MSESTERRHQTHHAIQQLLNERQQLWALYCHIAELQPFTAHQHLEAKLEEFCQLLVDYVSLGHFEIYKRINDGQERRVKVLEASREVYPKIVEATDAAVDFNDKYEKLSGDELRADLADDLSRLGEILVARNELEDRLIEALLF